MLKANKNTGRFFRYKKLYINALAQVIIQSQFKSFCCLLKNKRENSPFTSSVQDCFPAGKPIQLR